MKFKSITILGTEFLQSEGKFYITPCNFAKLLGVPKSKPYEYISCLQADNHYKKLNNEIVDQFNTMLVIQDENIVITENGMLVILSIIGNTRLISTLNRIFNNNIICGCKSSNPFKALKNVYVRCIDYVFDEKSKVFFRTLMPKVILGLYGKTQSQIIYNRLNLMKPNLGLQKKVPYVYKELSNILNYLTTSEYKVLDKLVHNVLDKLLGEAYLTCERYEEILHKEICYITHKETLNYCVIDSVEQTYNIDRYIKDIISVVNNIKREQYANNRITKR